MLPLQKEIIKMGGRIWVFRINPHFYGLTRNINGWITHSYKLYYVHIEYKDGSTLFNTFKNFREAFCYLIDKAVAPMFKY